VVPLVTVRSCIASNNADCVLGVARLISSASTKLAKIGPGWNRNALPPPVVAFNDHAADNVRRHQIRGELDARILQVKDPAQGSEQRSLAKTRHTFEQHMSAGKKTDEYSIDHVLLADDYFAYLTTNLIQVAGGELEGRVRMHLIILSGESGRSLGRRLLGDGRRQPQAESYRHGERIGL
jgi:hypothetical protein